MPGRCKHVPLTAFVCFSPQRQANAASPAAQHDVGDGADAGLASVRALCSLRQGTDFPWRPSSARTLAAAFFPAHPAPPRFALTALMNSQIQRQVVTLPVPGTFMHASLSPPIPGCMNR